METIRLTETNIEECVARANALLGAGGVILYPTDTLYGLGADAFSDDAVEKIYAIKGRDEKKPIHCIVADMAMAERYVKMNDIARRLAEKFLPGPLTLVVEKKKNVDGGITKHIETIGIRIPDNNFCIALAKAFGPYTTTSANLSGSDNQRSVAQILQQLGERAAMIDLVIDAGELPKREPSTVVYVSLGEAIVLREGAIPGTEIVKS